MKKNLDYYGFFKPNSNWHKIILTMKISATLFFCCLANIFATPTYSQATKISINLKDATIEEVLNKIEDVSEFYFLYNNKLIDVTRKVNIEADNEPIKDILSDILTNDVKTIIYDRQIILTPNNVSSFLEALQQLKINGTVTDSKNTPLAGVTVTVKGSTLGTITDASGKYIIDKASQNATLVFSFVGMAKQEIPLDGKQQIDVVMKEEAIGLEEVLVVGYGTQSKRNITSSISSVKSDAIANYAVGQIGQALQGKAAGVQIIQNSGSPGSALTVRIRGTGTINDSNPLYVVDGNLGADPVDLDPNDIESIEVLKSASAAAIYGAQGANGVILVTTKKGILGAQDLKVDIYSGIEQVHRFMPVMNAKQYATTYNQALVNGGRTPLFTNVESLGEGTDWQSAIFRVAPVNNVELSVSGGDEKGNYYISGGYYSQKGIVLGTDYDRLNFHVNSEHKINSAISLGENLSLSYSERNNIPEFGFNSPVPGSWSMDPTVPVKNPDGSWGFPKFSDINNPVAVLTLNNNITKRPVLNGSVYLDIKVLKNLAYRSQINMNLGSSNNYQYFPTYDIFPLQRNLTTQVSQTDSPWTNYDWQNTLTFKKTQGPHDINILGGVTVQSTHYESTNASGQGVPENANTDPNLRYLDLAKTGQTVYGSAGETSLLSFLGRVNYSYKGTYLFTGNIRADGSSKFGKNNRFGVFPSFSAGWRISGESFMKDIPFINDLKLRAGWGMLGNQNSLPSYAFANSLNSDLNYVFGQNIVQGQALTSQGNPDLKWEATKETEMGFDFTGFKNRVTLSVSYYNKNTTDMLLRVPIPAYTGIDLPPFVNGGNVVNKGFELAVSYQKTTPGEFFYDVSINISHNNNEVTKLSNTMAYIPSMGSGALPWARTYVGAPIGSFYGYVMDGIFQTQEEVNNHAFQTSGTSAGDIRFRDLNHDNVIDQNDRTKIGNPWPKMIYGLSANFRWKQFDLNLALQGTYGNDILACWKGKTEGSNFFNKDKDILNAWNGEGSSNTIPRQNVNDPNSNMRVSSYFIEDGSYLRLKHMQLGYTLPKGCINKIKKLRIYLSFENLLTFTKYNGFDPEIGSSESTLNIGQDYGFYPLPRITTMGLSLGI